MLTKSTNTWCHYCSSPGKAYVPVSALANTYSEPQFHSDLDDFHNLRQTKLKGDTLLGTYSSILFIGRDSMFLESAGFSN